jgi:hypothetical protein
VPTCSTNKNLSNNSSRNRIDEDTSWWNDDAGGSDDGNETESSSDDDNHDDHSLLDAPVAFETTSISYSTVPGATSNFSGKRKQKDSTKPRDETSQSDKHSASYQSMKTLDRLQQMLDDTDYMTKPTHKTSQRASKESLWTSKDRAKYKKQQRKMRDQGFTEQMRQHRLHEASRPKAPPSSNNSYNPSSPASNIHRPPPPPVQPFSEDDLSEESDDELGYTLPNLPVYYSDAEGESETEAILESNSYAPTTTSYIPKDEDRQRQHPSVPTTADYPHSHPQQTYAQQSPPPDFYDAQAYAAQQYQNPPHYYSPQPIHQQGFGNYPPNSITSNAIPPEYQHYQPPPQWTSPPTAGNNQAQSPWQPQTPNVVFQHPQSSLHPVPAASAFSNNVAPLSSTEKDQLAVVSTTRQAAL